MTDIDFDRVLREIDEEVRARRANGDFPPSMERELDAVFARYAPPTMAGDDLDALVEAADRTSFINPSPETGSRIPAVSLLKRIELKLFGWFFRFIAQQVTAFGGTVVLTLRQMAKRIEALEARTASVESATSAAPAIDADVVAAVGRVDGRVLVPSVEAVASFADAYAPDDELLDHLHHVDDGTLGGIVLSGVVDRAPLGIQVSLVERSHRVLRDGGRVAIVATAPEVWGRDNPIEADLAPGRPLHAETWGHLLERAGFRDVAVVGGERRNIVTATR